MTRVELILRTRQLIAEGERLDAAPSLTALQTWLQLSDDLLATAWGSMDRYHLAWLMVGKPKGIVRGRPMTPDEEAAYVREVAGQKTAALRMSLDAVERQGMPFRGETGGYGAGQGMGEVPGAPAPPTRARPSDACRDRPPAAEPRRRWPPTSATPTSRRARAARSPWIRSCRPAWTRHVVRPPTMRTTTSGAPRAPNASSADAQRHEPSRSGLRDRG